MMGDRPAQEPTELVIWSATALLGIVVGVGAAFTLWVQLHRTGEPAMLTAAVCALGVGLGLIGFAVNSLNTRLFLLTMAATLMIAFFAGAGAFASLAA